ncbi:MAG: DDE-type integrase/transposase/recombinase [Chromatiales bacterium]|nr:DDE-type integrase/transposase/recombinase [Chromatiales bacterium]
MPLDDLLAVTHEFISTTVSRSGLDRCRLRRHGASPTSRRSGPSPSMPDARAGQDLQGLREPGFVHVDVKYLPQQARRGPRAVPRLPPIDRATRWEFYVEILPEKTAQNAAGFLERLIAKAPFTITKVLTDNGKEFTDRFGATGEREPTGRHHFDRVCSANTIEHRLIQPRRPTG